MTPFDFTENSTTWADAQVTLVILYGPPRTRRGRLMNRIRRLLGRDEQDEMYAALTPESSTFATPR